MRFDLSKDRLIANIGDLLFKKKKHYFSECVTRLPPFDSFIVPLLIVDDHINFGLFCTMGCYNQSMHI